MRPSLPSVKILLFNFQLSTNRSKNENMSDILNFPFDQRSRKPVVLCILDGWGDREDGDDNAILRGNTPTWDRIKSAYPSAQLQASALDVGLPTGQMGNSEVGHMNLGAGRVVMQDLPRIDVAMTDGTIAENDQLKALVQTLTSTQGTCHLLGLVSPGGVHAHQNHLVALAGILDAAGIPTRLHAFLDGRDTPPSSAIDYVTRVIDQTAELKNFAIATVSGRYYAMDRNQNWDRIERAYRALAEGIGETAATALGAIDQGYAGGVTDEFILPTVIDGYDGMGTGDAVFMFNFRADRAREILTAVVDPAFDGFSRQAPSLSAAVGLTEYSTHLNQFLTALFPRKRLERILGEIVSDAGLTQLRIAETEKYAHVTFFFNGGEEKVFDGEERILIPSPKVATYDLQPEMSALEVTDALVDAIENTKFDLMIVNYANGDMVGHTGVMEAAMQAAETIDGCLQRLEASLLKVGGTMLVTADHGNAERMADHETGQPHTAHTLSPVPAILVNPPHGISGLEGGILADVAPTLVSLLGLPQPAEMTGRSLLKHQPETIVSHG